MPEDFVPADAHGGEHEAVTEQPLPPRPSRAARSIGSWRGRGAVEQQAAVARPELGVAGHRLAVEADRLRGVEQDVGHPVLARRDGLLGGRIAADARA